MAVRQVAVRRVRGHLALLSFVVPLAAWSGHRSEERYPAWFLQAPSVPGVRLAVGYAPLYGDTSASIAEALAFGMGALRMAGSLRVQSEYLQEVLPDGNVAFRGEHYVEDTLTDSVNGIALDTVILRRMVLLLVATDVVPVDTRVLTVASRPPAWTSATPGRGEAVHAMGTAEAHFNEHEAWIEAERHARRNLAFSIATTLRSRLQSQTGGTSDGALIATASAELRDLVVLERWRDARQLYVLVRARPAPGAGS